MAAHATTTPASDDRIQLGAGSASVYNLMRIAAVAGLAITLLLGFLQGDALRRFYFAYLTSFAYVLSIALGALAFVLLQYVTRAGWSVNVRRLAENIAATLPILAAATLPILVSVVLQQGDLYSWALPLHAATEEAKIAAETGDVPEEAEEPAQSATNAQPPTVGAPKAEKGKRIFQMDRDLRKLDAVMILKRAWLNPFFFIFRIVAYFTIWSAIALFFWKQSVRQDEIGGVAITEKLQAWSGPLLALLGLTVGFGAFDLFMSLDPHWYSTMFGVYYIAGCLVSSFAAFIVFAFVLQRAGYLRSSFSIEHYHDLGKFMFAFIFFWGYIAFSQFMLLWYANLPETVVWMSRRGATTAKVVAGAGRTWSPLAIALLFGMLLIPFAGVMSRHIKRRPHVLVFWAVWILVFHFVDMYWIVMPEYGAFKPHLMDLTALIGLVCLFVAAIIRNMSKQALRPTADPRLGEAMVFQNL